MSAPTATGARITAPTTLPRTNMRGQRPVRGRFDHARVGAVLQDIYGPRVYARMRTAGVDRRMMFGVNPHYWALAMGLGYIDPETGRETCPEMPPSKAVAALILPRLGEVEDMDGSRDPANQMDFTPQDDSYHGKLLHKYGEIVLGYASPVCSAHCRYCYRLDLFNKDTGKMRAMPEELRDYILDYNARVAAGAQGGYPVRELLLSGGDPLVLTNALIYRYAVAAGQAGVEVFRLGTKEMAFRPARFDDALAQTLRAVHARFPDMHVNIVAHFSHPDEFLLRDADGAYVRNAGGTGLAWMPESRAAVRRMLDLGFVSIENQTPIVRNVNDDSAALHTLHAELRRAGVKPKYIFQGRDIEGHRAFSLPVEETWRIHNAAMRGLSDTARSRLAMSTEWGKMEIVSVTGPGGAGSLAEGVVVFKIHRSPGRAAPQGDLVIARCNPDAMWISDYEDRILYDGR
ncbi:MAG TPA: hypothetical protein DDX54_06490 [Rhodospirillaceae bacterium]|jgi:lysine 2,3-aminomutase|nr:hypothetical protein [Alphaproteobacteria bacterium]HBH27031.1 hypothetical protein [Rhodospirillaceae bacterium]